MSHALTFIDKETWDVAGVGCMYAFISENWPEKREAIVRFPRKTNNTYRKLNRGDYIHVAPPPHPIYASVCHATVIPGQWLPMPENVALRGLIPGVLFASVFAKFAPLECYS